MTTRIFELSDEPVESERPREASFAARILCCIWAAVVSVIPAVTATYSALHITRFLISMKNTDYTNSSVFAHLHYLNTPMVIALGVSAFLALTYALAVVVEPKLRLASVGLPWSIGAPLLASMPALLLWIAETNIIDVFSGKTTRTTIASTAQTVNILLLATMISGLLVLGAAILFSIISLCISIDSRTDELSLRRAFVWAVAGTLLLVFAGAYFVLV